jgi:hypothetical protein
VNAGVCSLSNSLFCKQHGDDSANYTIPAAIDWMSIDTYHYDGPVDDWVRDNVRKIYQDMIYPNLTENQKVLLVPGAFGSDVNKNPNGSYICDRMCYDKMCAKDAVDFYDWAKSDPRVVGITPWNWGGCASCQKYRDEIGARDQPATRAAWFKIGDEIKQLVTQKGPVAPPSLKTDGGGRAPTTTPAMPDVQDFAFSKRQMTLSAKSSERAVIH